MLEPELEFPIKWTYVFGDACPKQGRCGCDALDALVLSYITDMIDITFGLYQRDVHTQDFPDTAWSVGLSAPNACTTTAYNGKLYYAMATRRSDGLYQFSTFSDSSCLNENGDAKFASVTRHI